MEPCIAHRPGLPATLIGYSASFALLLLFLWEGGCWHKSRKHEAWYIAGTLLLVPISGLFSGMAKLQYCFYQTSPHQMGVLFFRPALQAALAFQILQRSVWPRMLRRFFDLRPNSSKKAMAEHSKYAAHLARDLEETLSDILEQTPALLPDKALGPVFFLLLMADQVVWDSEMAESAATVPLSLVGSSLILFGLLFWIRRSRLVHPLVRHARAILKELTESQDKEMLQFVLASVSVATLLEVGGTTTVEQLSVDALDADMLTVLSKAIVLDALAASGIRFSQSRQEAVWRIIASCRGQELTRVKNLLDSGGTYHNLYKLVYTDVSKQEYRDLITRHFKAEAEAVRTAMGGSIGVKVLSDIDDTLYSSGGMFPAGCDTRFPKSMVYPGCLSLFRIIDSRGNSGYSQLGLDTCDLVFLSARPHIYKDMAEDRSYRLFRGLLMEERLHAMPTLLPGSLSPGLAAMSTFFCRGGAAWRRVGEAKYQTYLRFRELYAEYDFIFCGDNGQGDLYAGELMLGREEVPSVLASFMGILNPCSGTSPLGNDSSSQSEDSDSSSSSSSSSDPRSAKTGSPKKRSVRKSRMLAVLIHEVVPPERALAKLPFDRRDEHWRARLERQGFIFHRSYIGAALGLHARQPNLMTAKDVHRIVAEAMAEFDLDRQARPNWAGRWGAAESDLLTDLRAANRFFAANGLLPAREPVPVKAAKRVLLLADEEDEEEDDDDELQLSGGRERCERSERSAFCAFGDPEEEGRLCWVSGKSDEDSDEEANLKWGPHRYQTSPQVLLTAKSRVQGGGRARLSVSPLLPALRTKTR